MVSFLFKSYFLSLPQLHDWNHQRVFCTNDCLRIIRVQSRTGAILHNSGAESRGCEGVLGAKIDAGIARTGLSDDEIGLKVYISFHFTQRL